MPFPPTGGECDADGAPPHIAAVAAPPGNTLQQPRRRHQSSPGADEAVPVAPDDEWLRSGWVDGCVRELLWRSGWRPVVQLRWLQLALMVGGSETWGQVGVGSGSSGGIWQKSVGGADWGGRLGSAGGARQRWAEELRILPGGFHISATRTRRPEEAQIRSRISRTLDDRSNFLRVKDFKNGFGSRHPHRSRKKDYR